MDQKKYHQIQTQIQEARQALSVWNDRRAEAMIELDSIFTEMEEYKNQVTADRAAAENTIKELQANLVKADQDFHKHFEDYTNDMQELKLENETLSNQLQNALNELEKQKQLNKKNEEKYLLKMAQLASETEVRAADQQYQMKTQINNLVAELQAVQTERKSLSTKAEQYENELRVIRNQMMSFLNVTKEVAGAEVTAPIVVSANVLNATSEKKINTQVEASGATSENKNNQKKNNKLKEADMIVDTLGNAPTTVNDYLKRFGY